MPMHATSAITYGVGRGLAFLLASLTLLQAQYVGVKACAGCHPAQALTHSTTGHAHSLARVTPQAAAAKAPKADWAFGSGTHAITWVSRLDETHYLEHGQSWFAQGQTLARTPGHKDSVGVRYRTFDPGAEILRCFSCHSTGPPRVEPGNRIEPAEPGVNCEVCHGPGAAHVASGGGKFRIDNPARYRASAINEQCGSCHRQPDSGDGAPNWGDPWNARHQPLYLAESRCFQESGEKLSCLSCHDPHAPLARDSKSYDAVCKNCHAKLTHKSVLAARANSNCQSCHMPIVRPSPQLGFSNHWIGIYAPGQTLRPKR